MLDPHLRVPLLPAAREAKSGQATSATSTLYTATAKLPTRHGVFTARLRHLRTPALTWLDETVRFSITPPRHDEYPRFIVGAWPYYVGAASTALAWWGFCALWLALDSRDVDAGKKQA
jgi:oligosaccharyltransferase complex subunit beta